ncbi:MAG: pilus assembly protein CpaE [Candidatus Poriferisodalaceae bacterium]|jgi:pilus assembly protein CpaE
MNIHVVTGQAPFVDRIREIVAAPHEVVWQALQPTLALSANVASTGPSVVVIASDCGTAEALEIAAELDRLAPETVVLMAADESDDDDDGLWQKALLAGVREVLEPDPSDSDLRRSLGIALAILKRRTPVRSGSGAREPESAARRSTVIAVASAKGGVGKTTFATNLAIALAADHPDQVVLLDLDLHFGDAAYALGIVPEATIDEALVDDRPLTLTRLKPYLTVHRTGLFVACAPSMPADADPIKAASVASAIELLREQFLFVVIDTSAGMGEITLTAYENSTCIALVTTNEIPAIQAVRKQVETFRLIGFDHIPKQLVLNRSDSKVGLNRDDVERTIGLPVAAELPSSRTIPVRMNQGTPIVETDPRSGYAKAVCAFAERWRSDEVSARGRKARSVGGRAR